MYKLLLIPVDGSGTSNRAAHRALTLARRLGARAAFLHVPETQVYAEAPREEARAYGRALLDFWAGEAARAGVDAHTQVLEGPVADVIAQVARQLGCGAVVMGTHGRQRGPTRLLGSVAERVTRLAPCPVLLLRGDSAPEAWVVHPQRLPQELSPWPPGSTDLALTRVLVAVDGQPSGEEALAQAAGLAGALGAHLYVLHVIESFVHLHTPRSRAADWEVVRQAVRRDGRQVLTGAARRAQDVSMTPLLYEARGHPVAQAILQAASNVQADLIVVGTHNRRGLDRWLLGSVSSWISHRSEVPVLLVPLGSGAAALAGPSAPAGEPGEPPRTGTG
ncbi:universal stress protein [Deinococcus sp. NW-56]|uniref:universal stress protein n=1 Tax=Deinococcus sp. NW-56 TaxID=2080419 RepID=UPI001319BFCB|nr:universal stress protein [Deinococcus sp. NW-56]